MLQTPALAIALFEQVVRLRHIRDTHPLRIPLDCLAGAHRKITQQHDFGQRTGVVGKTGPGRAIPFTGVDPLAVDAGRRGIAGVAGWP